MKSIKYKILVNFCLIIFMIALITGGIVTWRLNLSIAKQSEMLSKDVTTQVYKTLSGDHQILRSFNENIKETTARNAQDLMNNPVVKTILENQMYDSLNELLASQFGSAEIDFAFLFGMDGDLLATFPQVSNRQMAETYYRSGYLKKGVTETLKDGGNATQTISGVLKVDASFIRSINLQERAGNAAEGITVAAAGIVRDSFNTPLCIVVTGTLLNGYQKFMDQLYNATGSSCALYIDNLPMTAAGYGGKGQNADIELPRKLLADIYNAGHPVNATATLAGEPHLLTCSALTSSENENLGATCVSLPESKIIRATSYGIETKKDLQTWFLIIGVLTVVVFGVVSSFIARSITGPLADAIYRLDTSGGRLAVTAGEISSASHDLSEGASSQAASLEESSASMEEMASMTKGNAENAFQANNLMQEVITVIKNANVSMQELTGSMKDISTASEETSKIIKTIDEIAFQTNLLALNAAVEAARAGEAGAGFAVVANEVRNLAMRAAEAARETGALIESTVGKIQDGSSIVDKTAKAFSVVTESTNKAASLVGEISTASQDQAQGIDQVNSGIIAIDKVTQANATQSETVAAAASELHAQSEQVRTVCDELMLLVSGTRNLKNEQPDQHSIEMDAATSQEEQATLLPA